MDGNDYINSLIMGWVSYPAYLSLLMSSFSLSLPHVTFSQLLIQVSTDLLPASAIKEENYIIQMDCHLIFSALGDFNPQA